jgi:hypothetical protein
MYGSIAPINGYLVIFSVVLGLAISVVLTGRCKIWFWLYAACFV